MDGNWFQGFGFYLFFNKIVECVGSTIFSPSQPVQGQRDLGAVGPVVEIAQEVLADDPLFAGTQPSVVPQVSQLDAPVRDAPALVPRQGQPVLRSQGARGVQMQENVRSNTGFRVSCFIYYEQGDSFLSKNVLCDANFNEYVGYIFNLFFYAQGRTVREIWVTRIVVNVAHEVSPLRPSDLCCSTGSPSWPGCWSSSCSSCVSRSCPS